MKIVIDCNVFVSAALNRGVCRTVVKMVLRKHQLFYSQGVMDELGKTFAKPYFLRYWRRGDVIVRGLRRRGNAVIPSTIMVAGLPDPRDAVYIATAKAADADILITGNQKHFPLDIVAPVRVMTPREFLDLYS